MTDTTNKTNNGKGKPKKQRLELTWIGKDEELKLEPRILIEDPEKSYGDKNSENMLMNLPTGWLITWKKLILTL